MPEPPDEDLNIPHEIEWFRPVRDLADALPAKDQEAMDETLKYVALFPDMCPLRRKGRFRNHRWFNVRNRWIVFYRHVGDTIYVRGLYPARARIP